MTSRIQLNKSIYVGSMLYADDIVLIQESKDDLQRYMFQLQEEIAEQYSLTFLDNKSTTLTFKGKYPMRTKL